MASVECQHLDKTWPNGVRAVVDLNLNVADGELLVCVGPSGCGKSTTLRMVAGLEEPSAGVLRIGGAAMNGVPPQRRNVAMVFQDYALYPHFTVRENLEFPLKMRRLRSVDRNKRVDWAAGVLNLGELLDRYPKQLSGGQRQRAAMGRALVREPAVFLLDEPLSNLDAKLRVQVRAEIGELQRRMGATMLYVTHDQVEAMTLGQRVAVFHQGRLQQVAAPAELYAQPANSFVAGFIGNPPMNLFPVQLVAQPDGGFAVRLGEHALPLPAEKNWSHREGRALMAGVRPELLHLAEAGEGGSFPARVVNIEFLGHETLLYVRPRGVEATLIARLKGMRSFASGEYVHLAAPAGALYLFDDNGLAA
ncbi:MAG TPA: ATP-binding cassette domain-containing protein [Methylococcaceae bacterium]|nr:ATP-binding cassette domain-containing protein [Methylococcaceae bacterium]